MQTILFGGKLLALNKADGGLRPIAIGYYWRRLAAKCANGIALDYLGDHFSPSQFGVGVKWGWEAAIHATRRYCSAMPSDHVLVKLDFKNAFNTIYRESVLQAVARYIPMLFAFCHLTYSSRSSLAFGNDIIYSDDGVQQGDPLGPLLFCLTIHPLLNTLQSSFKACYMDDVTLGGRVDTVEHDIAEIISTGQHLGLVLNPTKCELILPAQESHPRLAPGSPTTLFKVLDMDSAYLLGAPILTGTAMDSILTSRVQDLERAISRLCLLDAQDALLILRSAYSSPKLLNVLRSSPCSGHASLAEFDRQLRIGLSSITNCEINDIAWIQASQPIRCGGLGVRSVEMLAPSAYLASAAATLQLQDCILGQCQVGPDPFVEPTLEIWVDLFKGTTPFGSSACKQYAWDLASINKSRNILEESLKSQADRARLLAVSEPSNSDWLRAFPITSCGLRLSNEVIRIAVGLRLGLPLCVEHTCVCGRQVDRLGTHGLSCLAAEGKTTRHQMINDIIHRSLSAAGVPSIKEPPDTSKLDGKRPDGITIVPWKSGKSLAWDVTVADTYAPSYLDGTVHTQGWAAEAAAKRKLQKYAALANTCHFIPVAFESMGGLCAVGQDFVSAIGSRITQISGDPRETDFLRQRLSVALQRGNAACVLSSCKRFIYSDHH